MLKVARCPEEAAGAALMPWYGARGAARVLERQGAALLIERPDPPIRTLNAFVKYGQDDEATKILCQVAGLLHAPRSQPPPPLKPLAAAFRSLDAAASAQGGIYATAAATAKSLLAAPRSLGVLHGDLHHDNIVYFGHRRGWLAIDPKGYFGERAFDYANLFCNPDAATATHWQRFERRMQMVTNAAKLERRRMVEWILAWAGLSAAWMIEDRQDPSGTLKVAEMAAAELAR